MHARTLLRTQISPAPHAPAKASSRTHAAAAVKRDGRAAWSLEPRACSPSALIPPGGGRPLERAARADLEHRLGHDFSRVRIHCDDRAAAAAASFHARALTIGEHVIFGAGRFAPQTVPGRRLLAHELSHVVQQRGGVSVPQGLGGPGDQHERQADAVADRVMGGGSAQGLLEGWSAARGGAAPPVAVQRDAETSPAPEAEKQEPQSLLEQVAAAAIDAALKTAIRIIKSMPDDVLTGLGPVDAVAPLLKEAAIGFLRRLAAEGGAKVLKAMQTIAEAMKTPDYAIAFVKGFLYGFFVDGVFGLFVLFWDLGRLVVDLVQWLSGLGERLVSPEVQAILAELLGIAGGLSGQHSLIATLQARIASGAIVGDLLDFVNLVGDKVRSLAREIGDAAAAKMMEVFSGATAEVGAMLGDIAGKVTGFVTFMIVEGVLTAGGGSALSLVGQGLRKVLSVLGKGAALTADLLRGAAQGIRIGYAALKGWLTALRGSKVLSRLGELLDRLFARLQRLFEALIPEVEIGPELVTAGGPRGGPKMYMSAHEPPAPPRAGGGPSVKDLHPPKAAGARHTPEVSKPDAPVPGPEATPRVEPTTKAPSPTPEPADIINKLPRRALESDAYAPIRAITDGTDVERIAKLTGLSPERVAAARKHLMFDEHILVDNAGQVYRGRFEPYADVAERWLRIAKGERVTPDDIVQMKNLIGHEAAEAQIIGTKGLDKAFVEGQLEKILKDYLRNKGKSREFIDNLLLTEPKPMTPYRYAHLRAHFEGYPNP